MHEILRMQASANSIDMHMYFLHANAIWTGVFLGRGRSCMHLILLGCMAIACSAESRGMHIECAIWTDPHVQKLQAGTKWNGASSCMHAMSHYSINTLPHTNTNLYSSSNQHKFIIKPIQFHYLTMSFAPKYIINAHCNDNTYECDVYGFIFRNTDVI